MRERRRILKPIKAQGPALTRKRTAMKLNATILVLSLYAATALAANCKETAAEKSLAGAALSSFQLDNRPISVSGGEML
jgi:hypothetical protein